MFGPSGTRYSQTATGQHTTLVRIGGRASRVPGKIAKMTATRMPPPTENIRNLAFNLHARSTTVYSIKTFHFDWVVANWKVVRFGVSSVWGAYALNANSSLYPAVIHVTMAA